MTNSTEIKSEELNSYLVRAHNEVLADRNAQNMLPLAGTINATKNINRCSFNGGLASTGFTISKHLSFHDCVFGLNQGKSLGLQFISIKGGDLWFVDCTFHGKVIIEDIQVKIIYFLGCTFKDEMRINANKGESRKTLLQFSRSSKANGKFEQSVVITGGQLRQIVIRDCEGNHPFSFQGQNLAPTLIANGKYSGILLENVRELSNFKIIGDTDFVDGLKIDLFRAPFMTMASDGAMTIRNATIKSFSVQSLTQKTAEFSLHNIKFEHAFFITDSDLGRLTLNQIDLTNAKFCLDHTFIGKCDFSNINWPKNHLLVSNRTSDQDDVASRAIEASILREAYRQLKNAMNASSNNIDALWFYRNELDEYWKEINTSKSVPRAERFVLRINKYTSDFGLSWTIPLTWLLALHLLLFCGLVCFHYDNLRFTTDINWAATKRGCSDFLVMLSPIHELTNREGAGPGIKILDFVMRISSGFFIYHILRATRKYSKL